MRRMRCVLVVLAICVSTFLVPGLSAAPGDFSVLNPTHFTRTAQGPATTTHAFTAPLPGGGYRLRLENGGDQHQFAPSSSAVVLVNGVQILGPTEFKPSVVAFERDVILAATNELVVELRSAPGTGFTVSIIGSETGAPLITASATPAANSNNWNNTDVVVSFTCSDAISGIASCSAPVIVSTQGANQVVTGTAVDMAGNTSTTTVTVNLDKTAPVLSIGALPGTVSDPDLTLTGTVSDVLSGVQDVACNGVAATLAAGAFSCDLTLAEGNNTIAVTAMDRAGNLATSSVDVALITYVPPPFGPAAVTWMNPVNVSTDTNNISKAGASTAFDAGAVSEQVLRDGYGFVEFTATETNTTRMAGLGSVDVNQDYTDVDYAVLLRSNGGVAVYEGGVYRGEKGTYSSGDRFRVEVRYGVVRYLRNGSLLFASPLPVRYPLRVDTSMMTPGATLTDVRVGNLVWTGETGVAIDGESIEKTGASGWTAGAYSANTIEWGDGYFEFSAAETDTTRLAGLANLIQGVAVSDIRFGLQLNSDATLEVVESGVSKGVFGSYSSGDRLRVELSNGVIRYFRNGVQIYTSSQAPVYPLRADSALNTPGATITNAMLEPIAWASSTNTYTTGATLIKKTADGWTATASSSTLLESGDGYVEFTSVETDTRRGLGLKWAQAGQSDPIDFSVVLLETGAVEVVELGQLRGQFGSYQNGDRFRIEVANGQVRYLKNGTAFYSSGTSPSYPLRAEAAFYTKNATLFDVAMGDLVWMNGVNTRVAGRILMKSSGVTAWDAGAVSTRTIDSGFMEFTASEGSTARMAGLSNGDTNQDYTDIDFAIQLRIDSQIGIWESGVFRGYFGTYVPGDRLRVQVQSGVVRYFHNGLLLHVSGVSPTLPLRIDTSENGGFATLFNVVLR